MTLSVVEEKTLGGQLSGSSARQCYAEVSGPVTVSMA